jgi:hypothetical protein
MLRHISSSSAVRQRGLSPNGGGSRFGEDGEMRWLEVAPPGSAARLALNPPMRDEPGGGAIGVETPPGA